jgi:hypothetical protein
MGETGVQRNLREEMLPLLPHFWSVDENAVFQIAVELPAECSRGRFSCRPLSVAQHQLQDDAGGDRNQNIVAADLNPMVTTGRGTQLVGAPVINNISSVAVFDRQAFTAVELMLRACTTFVPVFAVVHASLALRSIRLASLVLATIRMTCLLVLTILRATALHLLIVPTISAILMPLGEGKSSREQRHCHDVGHDYFPLHPGLIWVEKFHVSHYRRPINSITIMMTTTNPKKPLGP